MGGRAVVLFLILPSTIGCSTAAWYEGLRARQRQECYERRSGRDVEACLENVNGATYDEYRRARTGGESDAQQE